MRGDDVAAAVGDPLDRRLEGRILEGLDLAAIVAHEVVMMVAARVCGLETRDAVSEVDALDEPQRVHAVESPVDARDPDAPASPAHSLVDLLRGEAAVLLAEELDDESPRAAAPSARRAELRERAVRPGRGEHGDNDIRSQRRATLLAMRAGVVALLVLVTTGCASMDADPERAVVASFYPLAWATERVAGGATSAVVNLTPPGVEPHDIELSPSDVERIRDAQLVVYLSGGFQPAVEEAVAERDGPSLDLLGGESDLHIWLDPVRFAEALEAIARTLGVSASADDAVHALNLLDDDYRRGLADCKRRVLVTTHAAFGHLAARYGLTQLSLAGRSPEAEPTPRELEELIEKVRASGATTVFAEPLVSDRLAETVAREAGANVATLDPIEGLSGDRLDAGEDYLSVMRENLAALREALGCR